MPFAQRDETGALICLYAMRQDYADEWLDDDAPEIVAFLTPSSIPQVVTRFQARAALHLSGILDEVETLMQQESTDILARLLWENAIDFQRDNETIAAIAQILNLNDDDLDNLFIVAAGIVS